ncbi:MAG TPA: hypothetical protein VHO01_11830 [Jatrophihabitans sp.]|nr:hypothetical protein [Jatrophihabitans sp.]
MGRISVQPSAAERIEPLPGDELVARADVVMDRCFTVPAPPEQVWPWLVQLGKRRAGWYLPRPVERWLPRRASRRIEPAWQQLAVGAVVPDWGGRQATFTVVDLAAGAHVVFWSRRGRLQLTWAVVLRPEARGSRVQLRLRLGGVRHRRLARYAGGVLDWLTVLGLAAGLRERVADGSG